MQAKGAPTQALQLDSNGLMWGFVSYLLWGIFPLYWKFLVDRSAVEILAHRMVWSFVFYLLLFVLFARRPILGIFRQSRRDWLLSILAACILTFNWGIYIYAVNSDRILEGSLAYFINPILNVAVGVLFFKEDFPPVLRWAVGFAALGVMAKLSYSAGAPWISLALAFSFCVYGITKKKLKIPPTTSSLLEGAIALLPALIMVFYFTAKDDVPPSPTTWLLFVGGGVVTGLPLFLFSYAAQRIPYSVMGMLQFIAPSLQFIVAVAVFHEPLGIHNAIAFGLIWVGAAFYLFYQVLNLLKMARKIRD